MLKANGELESSPRFDTWLAVGPQHCESMSLTRAMQEPCTLGLDFFFTVLFFEDTHLPLLPPGLNKGACFYGPMRQTSPSLSQVTKINVCLNKKRNYLYD